MALRSLKIQNNDTTAVFSLWRSVTDHHRSKWRFTPGYRFEFLGQFRNTYYDADFSNDQAALKEMVISIFVIRCEGCEVDDEPADVGLILEEVIALEDLGNVANGVARLIGLILYMLKPKLS
ncbi:sterile alpha motif domain-containing protein 3-like [Silurus asotus]|uniref:Sterile alpha motif domain-containing protein 3-like n=1 Tax=Silurus asotus TaxID=30991 RepID=A0AAD5AYX5_SILAS|nr:sterile alpha motif domain-containing protein 3-like [Silurus asotus]